jgi:C-terminal processing protease CtpA/Prc
MRSKFIIWLVLVSCSVGPHYVLKENPQAIYSHESKRKVSQKIKSDLMYKGFDIKASEENKVYLERLGGENGSAKVIHTKYDLGKKEQLAFSLSDTGSGTQVVASYFVVTDPGSPMEKTTDLSLTKAGDDIQAYLDNLKIDFEMDTLGRIGVMLDSTGRVVGVTNQGGAFYAGLLAGDSIISIDAHPIPFGNPTAISRAIAGTPNSKVEIGFIRGGETKTASVLRKRL